MDFELELLFRPLQIAWLVPVLYTIPDHADGQEVINSFLKTGRSL